MCKFCSFKNLLILIFRYIPLNITIYEIKYNKKVKTIGMQDIGVLKIIVN